MYEKTVNSMNTKKKTKRHEDKYGVFQGDVISVETLGVDRQFVIEEYNDVDLTVTSELKKIETQPETQMVNVKLQSLSTNKKKTKNPLLMRIAIYATILLAIAALITYLAIKLS